jgi:large subunit ribosomal protein L43
MKDYLASQIIPLAREYPGVEVVVRRRPFKHPVVRGVYGSFLPFFSSSLATRSYRWNDLNAVIDQRYLFTVNGRDKVICLRSLPPPSISTKVQLLLDSSGSKIVELKRPRVDSTTQSVRGIWSAFHEEI